jgi:queuine tRNA-ribosyltransferase
MEAFRFEIAARDPGSRARAGTLHTLHGPVDTPAFAPVGTHGAVKSLTPRDLLEIGVEILMTNAYHLDARPGARTVRDLGGMHRFCGWDRPIMTDSGGFQVFSLSDRREVDDDGVTFRDPLDGQLRRSTPESVIQVQTDLGSDIIFPLDVCTPYPAHREQTIEDLERTHRWAERALKAFSGAGQALFGIVQGGTHPDLRSASATAIGRLGFSGFGIGGVSVGEPKGEMLNAVEIAVEALPESAPRHLLGVGYPEDFVAAVARGIDTFDCVMPTRIARNGAALTMKGRMNLRNAEFASDAGPIDPACECYACKTFTRGAIRHWLKSGEILPLQLLTMHNLHFMLTLARRTRAAILEGTFTQFRSTFQIETAA